LPIEKAAKPAIERVLMFFWLPAPGETIAGTLNISALLLSLAATAAAPSSKPRIVEIKKMDAAAALWRVKVDINLLFGCRRLAMNAGCFDERRFKVRLFHLNVVVTN